MEPTRTERSGWTTGLIAGGLIGFIAASGLGGIGVLALGKREYSRARAGWNLVPVIVYNQDLAAGTAVTFDVVSQRSIPEQFVTASIITPNDASRMIGARLAQPVQAGDPATWQGLADGKGKEGCETVCRWAAEAEPARAQKIRDAMKRLEPSPVAKPEQ